MRTIVEKIKHDTALLLVGKDEIKVNLPIILLPKGIVESDVIKFSITPCKKENYSGKNKMIEKFTNFF